MNNSMKKFQKERFVGATITRSVKITSKQYSFVLKNNLNLSKLTRDLLNKMIGENDSEKK